MRRSIILIVALIILAVIAGVIAAQAGGSKSSEPPAQSVPNPTSAEASPNVPAEVASLEHVAARYIEERYSYAWNDSAATRRQRLDALGFVQPTALQGMALEIGVTIAEQDFIDSRLTARTVVTSHSDEMAGDYDTYADITLIAQTSVYEESGSLVGDPVSTAHTVTCELQTDGTWLVVADR